MEAIPMDKVQQVTLSRIISMSMMEKHRYCKIALLYARTQGIEPECKAMIIKSRMEWLNWKTTTQREWQHRTKNINKARHHDSIEIRERYVRC